MKRKRTTKLILVIGAILAETLFWGWGRTGEAYIMQSSNYRLERDSLNVGGLDSSTSTNYQMKDTIGETATGLSESASYRMHAGYRQMEGGIISLTVPASLTLSPTLDNLNGGTASGSSNFAVTCSVIAGYSLTIKASDVPAMQSASDSFQDYTPVTGGVPDYDWNLRGAQSEFGFSVYNADGSQVSLFKNNGADCNTGSTVTDEVCWYGLSGSNLEIANRSSQTSGAETTKVNWQAEIDSGVGVQTAGNYTATVIVTAVSN